MSKRKVTAGRRRVQRDPSQSDLVVLLDRRVKHGNPFERVRVAAVERLAADDCARPITGAHVVRWVLPTAPVELRKVKPIRPLPPPPHNTSTAPLSPPRTRHL